MLRIHVAEFAAFDAARDRAAHNRQTLVDDLLAIKPHKLGKISRFRDQYLRQHDPVAGVRELRQRGEDEAQQLARRSFIGAHILQNICELRADGFAHQRLEHRVLVFEIEIDRAFGHAGTDGDVVHARGGESFFRKTGQRGVQDFLRPCLFAPAPTGGGGVHGFH